jgi:thiopurine S-methyltransferase
MRVRYAAHLRTLLDPNTPGLVITFEYPDGALDGPPFSVPEAELRAYFPKVMPLAERPADGPRIRETGATAMERLYEIRG